MRRAWLVLMATVPLVFTVIEAQYANLKEWEESGEEPVRSVRMLRSELRWEEWNPA